MEPWFLWLIIGLVCIGLELVIPGLVIIFFGLGALLTALISLLPGIVDNFWLQILIFVLSSALALLFLRKYASSVFKGTVFYQSKNSNNGEKYAQVIEDINPQKNGRIKYGGTTWTARCTSSAIQTGNTVRVLHREGMTYVVEPVLND